MKLIRERTQAVMIDMQERLLPAMRKGSEVHDRTALLMEGLKILEIPITVTQQYTRGLGSTMPDLMEAAGRTREEYTDKLSFSCLEEPDFLEAIGQHPGRDQFLLCGVETHICVQATALDLLSSGREVFVVCDCVDSRFACDREISLRRLEQAGAVLTTAEAVLFELVGRAGTDEFRKISKLVK